MPRSLFLKHMFPREIRENLTDPDVFYDVAFQNTNTNTKISESKTVELHSEDQKFITTLLEGDELRRIQHVYFLCTYPNILSQMKSPPNTVAKDMEISLVYHCQNRTLHTLKEHFFGNNKNSTHSPYLDTLSQ